MKTNLRCQPLLAGGGKDNEKHFSLTSPDQYLSARLSTSLSISKRTNKHTRDKLGDDVDALAMTT